jgi:hypothetical protein
MSRVPRYWTGARRTFAPAFTQWTNNGRFDYFPYRRWGGHAQQSSVILRIPINQAS